MTILRSRGLRRAHLRSMSDTTCERISSESSGRPAPYVSRRHCDTFGSLVPALSGGFGVGMKGHLTIGGAANPDAALPAGLRFAFDSGVGT